MAFLFLHNIYVQNEKKRHSLEKVLKTGSAILNGQKKRFCAVNTILLLYTSLPAKLYQALNNLRWYTCQNCQLFFYFYSFGVLQKKSLAESWNLVFYRFLISKTISLRHDQFLRINPKFLTK
jgi:hypothetical protein